MIDQTKIKEAYVDLLQNEEECAAHILCLMQDHKDMSKEDLGFRY